MPVTPFRKILVPTDFSSHSRLALEHAVELAKASGGSIVLLAVIEPYPFIAGDITVAVPGWSPVTLEEYGRKEAEKQLQAEVDALTAQGVTANWRTDFGGPAAAIVSASKNFDLVVLGTHGRSGLARAFLGSVAQQVVARSACPVLTVCDRAAEKK